MPAQRQARGRMHRRIESEWSKLEPRLKDVAKDHDAVIDASQITALLKSYQMHARYEEEVFLPLSQTILGRNSNHLSALGMSIHLRHVMLV